MAANAETYRADSAAIGQKAIRLAEIAEAGFPVPPFCVLGDSELRAMLASDDSGVLDARARAIAEELHATKFAVRSAALSEDAETDSQAGLFTTVLDISVDGIPQAIRDVVADAREKQGIEAPFSVIIQMYIDAERAGVIFTRNPIEGREMIVEWRRGAGSAVVGGADVERASVLPAHLPSEPFPGFHALCQMAAEIEAKYDTPQDIEWVVRHGAVSIVQVRPLTTVTRDQFNIYKRIDASMPKGDHYYDQSALGEAFVGAPPLATEILEHLHTEGGIARAYRRVGILPGRSLAIRRIANATYMDMERELQHFFPAQSYFGGDTLVPHFRGLSGLWRTITNMMRFAFVPVESADLVRAGLRARMQEIASAPAPASWNDAFDEYNAAYEEVFLVNLYAEKTLRAASAAGLRYGVNETDIFSIHQTDAIAPAAESDIAEALESARGNSINIADESAFVGDPLRTRSGATTDVPSWTACSEIQKRVLSPLILRAQIYAHLREEGRWLGVLATGRLRAALFTVAARAGVGDARLLYFAALDELSGGSLSEAELRERKEHDTGYGAVKMPTVIASISQQIAQDSYGVSTGVVAGVVCSPEQPVDGGILLADRLSPELAEHFSTIRGVIAREGGVLSHLAIVARERGIPVVIERRPDQLPSIGDIVEIDGRTGSIRAQ